MTWTPTPEERRELAEKHEDLIWHADFCGEGDNCEICHDYDRLADIHREQVDRAIPGLLAALELAEAEHDRLRAALVEALEWGDEGWSYASDYFREKWSYDGERARIAAALAPADDPEKP